MVGGKRMNWMENLLIVAGVSLDIFAAMECQGSLVAKINKKNLTVICGIVALADLVLPRVGEVSRCGMLAKYDDVSFAKSLGTVVTERLIDTLTILLITGITFLMQMPVFLRFFEETGTKVPSLVHLVTSPWFYVVLFSIIGVLVLLYFLLRMRFFLRESERVGRSMGGAVYMGRCDIKVIKVTSPYQHRVKEEKRYILHTLQ